MDLFGRLPTEYSVGRLACRLASFRRFAAEDINAHACHTTMIALFLKHTQKFSGKSPGPVGGASNELKPSRWKRLASHCDRHVSPYVREGQYCGNLPDRACVSCPMYICASHGFGVPTFRLKKTMAPWRQRLCLSRQVAAYLELALFVQCNFTLPGDYCTYTCTHMDTSFLHVPTVHSVINTRRGRLVCWQK